MYANFFSKVSEMLLSSEVDLRTVFQVWIPPDFRQINLSPSSNYFCVLFDSNLRPGGFAVQPWTKSCY